MGMFQSERNSRLLSLRPIRRFRHSFAAVESTNTPAAASNRPQIPISINEPPLLKLKTERDPDKLFQLFGANAHNPLLFENQYAFQDTVSRLAGAARFDYIENLLEHQKTLPQGRREGFIIRIIMLYGKTGMISHAVNTFYDMHLFGCSRTVKSFNAAIKVLGQTRDLEAVYTFLREVPAKCGIELDLISVNIVVKAFCEMMFLNRAYFFMVEMEKRGVRPDVVTYTTLISEFYKDHQWEIGNGLWNLMVLKGCFPNLATFNVRIQYLVYRRRAWQANSLMGTMRKIGIMPDEVTYNLVMKGFFQAGYLEMAKRVYSALHDKGLKPNIKVYQTMIHYLCKGGELELAYTMCKDCMSKNRFPNLGTIYTLLEGLKNSGKLGKANMIMTLVRKRTPPFPSQELSGLLSIFSRSRTRVMN